MSDYSRAGAGCWGGGVLRLREAVERLHPELADRIAREVEEPGQLPGSWDRLSLAPAVRFIIGKGDSPLEMGPSTPTLGTELVDWLKLIKTRCEYKILFLSPGSLDAEWRPVAGAALDEFGSGSWVLNWNSSTIEGRGGAELAILGLRCADVDDGERAATTVHPGHSAVEKRHRKIDDALLAAAAADTTADRLSKTMATKAAGNLIRRRLFGKSAVERGYDDRTIDRRRKALGLS